MISHIHQILASRKRRRRVDAHVEGGPRMEHIEPRTLLSASIVDGLLTIDGTAGDDVISVMAGAAGGEVIVNGPDIAADTVFSSVTAVTINGLEGSDTITFGPGIVNAAGSKIGATINGGDGDDTLVSGSGNDAIDGGADTLDFSGAASAINVRLDTGRVKRDGRGGRDTVANVENVIGTSGNDVIYGDASDNVLTGGDGNDVIRGNGGNDTVDAGDGNNVVVTGAGDDAVISGEGNDRITDSGGTNTINAGNGNNRVVTGDGDDTVTTGSGNDVVFTRGGNDIIDTDGGNDVIRAGDGDDDCHSGAGDDRVYGEDGDDFLDGEEGDDRLDGGRDDDDLHGGEDDDDLRGADGYDDLNGESGNDRLDGGRDDDALYGGDDDDDLRGGDGDDDIHGELGDDRLDGGRDDDHVRGGDDDDDVRGGHGDDDVDGEDGDDRVRGGRGRDYIRSGLGDDDVEDDDRDDDFYGDDDVEDDDDNDGEHDDDDDNPSGGPNANATEVVFDDQGLATLTGTSLNKDDRDIFRFTAATDGSITVESTTTNGNFAKVEIEAAGDDEQEGETEPNDGIHSFAMNLTAGTTYFIKIKSPNLSPAEYVVNLTSSADILPGGGGDPPAAPADVLSEVEPNDGKPSALEFAFPDTNIIRLLGTSLSQDDRDYFKFTAPADGTLTVNLYSGDGQSANLEIENQFGADVLEIEQEDGQHTAQAQVVAGVTYYVRIKSETGGPADYIADLTLS